MTLGDVVDLNIGERKKRTKLWYIGARYNPQFDKPYYVAYGQLSKADAKKKEGSIYGSMHLTGYSTQQEYENKIQELNLDGFRVR
jgi:hypothetical protein